MNAASPQAALQQLDRATDRAERKACAVKELIGTFDQVRQLQDFWPAHPDVADFGALVHVLLGALGSVARYLETYVEDLEEGIRNAEVVRDQLKAMASPIVIPVTRPRNAN